MLNKKTMPRDMSLLECIDNQISLSIVDEMYSKSHNHLNITVTLSTLWGVAQPWRFFFACRKVAGGHRA